MPCDKHSQGSLPLQEIRLPFGISSAPAIFQKVMVQVIQGLKGVACYLDDLIFTGATKEEHFKNLEAVFKRIQKFGFRIRKEKCGFLKFD